MTKKRSPEDLMELASPILKPYHADRGWHKAFFDTLVKTAEKLSPHKANKATYAVCLKEGLSWHTADHFANACRWLAILRKFYEDEFFEVIEKR